MAATTFGAKKPAAARATRKAKKAVPAFHTTVAKKGSRKELAPGFANKTLSAKAQAKAQKARSKARSKARATSRA
ncbi:MAG: hypothetical protein N4A65_03255, partial [Cohaesibacter sp.]|nr:hypothetical protein [Cohaesibacter sp.]